MKKDDFPTFGTPATEKKKVSRGRVGGEKNKPTMPILRLLLGLPRRIFFSWTAFFGGILLALKMEEEEKKRIGCSPSCNRFIFDGLARVHKTNLNHTMFAVLVRVASALLSVAALAGAQQTLTTTDEYQFISFPCSIPRTDH